MHGLQAAARAPGTLAGGGTHDGEESLASGEATGQGAATVLQQVPEALTLAKPRDQLPHLKKSRQGSGSTIGSCTWGRALKQVVLEHPGGPRTPGSGPHVPIMQMRCRCTTILAGLWVQMVPGHLDLRKFRLLPGSAQGPITGPPPRGQQLFEDTTVGLFLSQLLLKATDIPQTKIIILFTSTVDS